LDNAASSQKPQVVIDALVDYYSNHNANVHRGLHTLSEEATEMYERARASVARFINASSPEEVAFTKGATESLNRVAFTWGLANLHAGDVILVTDAEHHSNLIPWQLVAKKTGAVLAFLKTDEHGELDTAQVKLKLTSKVKLVSLAHASNMLGTIFPVKGIAKLAHSVGAVVCVDGAQAIPHVKVDVQSLGVDFYAFSGHKMLGPTGIGVLWVRRELLANLEPYEYGGGMIDDVSYTSATYAQPPEKFEAGTPPIAEAVGLKSAIEYLEKVGMDNIQAHEIELNTYALEKLNAIEGVTIYGPKDPEKRTGLVSFTVTGIHAHDVASVMNTLGVAVRSGHHCTMPLHKKLGIPASVRASYYLYNTKADIDKLVEGILKAKELLS
jgi:cysteine desulfurase/selenocysteine lyase